MGSRSIAVDEGDGYLAAVTADLGEAASSSVRIYHIGRRPAQVGHLSTYAHVKGALTCGTVSTSELGRAGSQGLSS